MKYCENCSEENLTKYLEDDTGSIFCSEKCFKEYCKEVRNNIDFQIVEDLL